MKAVILAGGFGTRIQPLTSSIPKPMLPVVNIPMMEYNIRKLHKIGIDDFVILLYFKSDVIKNYFKDGSGLGVHIDYVLPDKDYGTAGAVRQAKKFLDEEFIIVSGDLVTDFDFGDIVGFHKSKKSVLTIGVTRVDNPLQFGVVVLDRDGKIIKFLEKPSWGEVINDMINTGIYVISPEVLDLVPPDEPFDFSKDLFPLMMNKGMQLWGYLFKGYWRDVGNIKSYIDVHNDILTGVVDPGYAEPLNVKELERGCICYKRNCQIHPSAKIHGRVVLGRNVYIGEGVLLENCVLGDNVVVRDNSVIKDSVIWSDVEIDQFSWIKHSVVCNNVRIGRRVEIGEDCVISECCSIGNNVEIVRGVIVWPHKYIEEDAVVNRNVIWGDTYKSSIFSMGVVEGTPNVELTGDISSKIAEAFGSIFPEGSKIYVGRDYYKSSRMVKRFIMGGLLSVGVNVVDLEVIPPNVLRYKLYRDEEGVGGIHVRKSALKQDTKICFFTNEGALVDNNLAKSIEKIYFTEKFRRVNPTRIGEILHEYNIENGYKDAVLEKIYKSPILDRNPKIVANLMHGTLSIVYPDIIEKLGVKSVIIDAHYEEEKSNVQPDSRLKESADVVSQIVRHLSFDMGFLLYPGGQKLDIVDDEGELLRPYRALLCLLMLINKQTTEKKMVFLPPWAPNIIDKQLDNLSIYRGKLMGKKIDFLKDFYLIADVDGHYDFTDFGFHSDSVFASIKLIEIVSSMGLNLSQIKKQLPSFYYNKLHIKVSHNKKALVMKNLSNYTQDENKITYNSGIRVDFDPLNWIFVIPDDKENFVRLYVQAEDEKKGKSIEQEYKERIEKWAS